MTHDAEPTVNGSEPPVIVGNETAYKTAAEVTELIRMDAGDITATTVTLEQSGAEQITAERVQLDRSGAKSMTTKSATLDRSGVLFLQAASTVLQRSSAMVIETDAARIVKSRVLVLRSGATTVEGELRTLVYIGPAADGIKPVLVGADALRFGAALGFVLFVVGRLFRRLPGARH